MRAKQAGGAEESRQSGSLIIELLIGLTILTIGLLGFFFTFYANYRGEDRTRQIDDVRVALDNTAELLRGCPLEDVYSTYHGTSVDAPGLFAADGSAAQVQINCRVDETTLPAEFGPIADIDGDGQLASTNCSTSYLMLPVELTLTYAVTGGGGIETRNLYLVLGDL